LIIVGLDPHNETVTTVQKPSKAAAKEDFCGSASKDTTLLEVMLHRSVDQAKANGSF